MPLKSKKRNMKSKRIEEKISNTKQHKEIQEKNKKTHKLQKIT